MRAHHLLLSSPPTHAPQAAKKPGRALTRAATGTVIGAALGLVLLPGGGPRTPALLAAEPPLITTTASAVPPSTGSRAWGLRQTPVVDVVRRVKDAVVNIHSERTVRANPADELFSLSPSQSRVSGMGTGIVIDPRGYIVTNQHVVEDVSLIRVRLSDGTTATARILSRDAQEDLALLKINPPRPLPVMPMGTASDLMVGETVVAIGNAYGYDHTVTVGVAGGKGPGHRLRHPRRHRVRGGPGGVIARRPAGLAPGRRLSPLLPSLP